MFESNHELEADFQSKLHEFIGDYCDRTGITLFQILGCLDMLKSDIHDMVKYAEEKHQDDLDDFNLN